MVIDLAPFFGSRDLAIINMAAFPENKFAASANLKLSEAEVEILRNFAMKEVPYCKIPRKAMYTLMFEPTMGNESALKIVVQTVLDKVRDEHGIELMLEHQIPDHSDYEQTYASYFEVRYIEAQTVWKDLLIDSIKQVLEAAGGYLKEGGEQEHDEKYGNFWKFTKTKSNPVIKLFVRNWSVVKILSPATLQQIVKPFISVETLEKLFSKIMTRRNRDKLNFFKSLLTSDDPDKQLRFFDG